MRSHLFFQINLLIKPITLIFNFSQVFHCSVNVKSHTRLPLLLYHTLIRRIVRNLSWLKFIQHFNNDEPIVQFE